jgi:hypothetical protein
MNRPSHVCMHGCVISVTHSSLPCHCQPLALLLPLHPVPLSCMQLLSCCQACHPLPSISSSAPLLLLALIASLVSLAVPLASVAATGCECVPRVSASSKSYERKRKGDIYMYHFCDEIKSQNRFLDVTKLLTLKFGYFSHCAPP